MDTKAALAAVILGCIIFFAVGCSNTQPPRNIPAKVYPKTPAPLPAPKFDEVATGQKVYAENCVKCHKQDGSGGITKIDGNTIDAKSLRGPEIHSKSEAELIRAIMEGSPKKGMPAFREKLSEAELRAVAAKIRREFAPSE